MIRPLKRQPFFISLKSTKKKTQQKLGQKP